MELIRYFDLLNAFDYIYRVVKSEFLFGNDLFYFTRAPELPSCIRTMHYTDLGVLCLCCLVHRVKAPATPLHYSQNCINIF